MEVAFSLIVIALTVALVLLGIKYCLDDDKKEEQAKKKKEEEDPLKVWEKLDEDSLKVWESCLCVRALIAEGRGEELNVFIDNQNRINIITYLLLKRLDTEGKNKKDLKGLRTLILTNIHEDINRAE